MRTDLYAERAPEAATSSFSKISGRNWTVLISSKNLRKINAKQIAKLRKSWLCQFKIFKAYCTSYVFPWIWRWDI